MFPKIKDAKALAKRDNLDSVIILYFKDDQFGYVSYGKNKRECKTAKERADKIFETLWKDDKYIRGWKLG